MPIKVQSGLPAREKLERENVFTMDENRAMHQDIRPIEVGILNLMPLKEDTELQILRELSNTPLQVDVTFVVVGSHESRNTSSSHLNKFYNTFDEIKEQKFDGFIITGAPVEQMESEVAKVFSVGHDIAKLKIISLFQRRPLLVQFDPVRLGAGRLPRSRHPHR